MAKKIELDIEIKESKRGSFTKWAKSRGMTPCQAAKKVLKNKKDYSKAIVKKATFANNFGCKVKK